MNYLFQLLIRAYRNLVRTEEHVRVTWVRTTAHVQPDGLVQPATKVHCTGTCPFYTDSGIERFQ